MNISAVKLHNDKLDDIKDRLKTIEVVVNEVYLEDIKLDDSGVKEVKVADQQTEIDPRSKTTADKAFNLIGTGGPEEEVQGQGAVLAEKKRKSKAY